MKAAITPGEVWLDTAGERIQAHGGSLFFEDGVYYWYGENKERTTPGSGIWHWGIRCYSSTDLYDWTDLGLIVPPDTDDPSSPLHPERQLDRPHIVRNAATGKYVCWIKVMGGGDTQLTTTLVADRFLGPYAIAQQDFRPYGMNAGDFDIAIDPETGAAHYYFDRVHTELVCADLTDDYTGVAERHTSHFPRERPPFVREAPAHFEHDGRHYLITSGTTWYFPNPSEAAVADDPHGPWTVLGDPHPGDPHGTSFRSQISSVFRHPERDLLIAVADRWIPGLPPEESNRVAEFDRMFAPEGDARELEFLDVDTSVADYVWLPIRFDGDRPVIDWHDEWRIEDYPLRP
ncbi:family 43 glycosylhydrolase [Leifsonia sp. NPDC058194]|uniref:family 43 glycosylhydrolase n=1 Tax=Leifsonia sp. NPDC058194 TaxID=3346374 RepID=UPI0036D92274